MQKAIRFVAKSIFSFCRLISRVDLLCPSVGPSASPCWSREGPTGTDPLCLSFCPSALQASSITCPDYTCARVLYVTGSKSDYKRGPLQTVAARSVADVKFVFFRIVGASVLFPLQRFKSFRGRAQKPISVACVHLLQSANDSRRSVCSRPRMDESAGGQLERHFCFSC